ncbi:DnaJ domain protein [Dictyocaulus viviparus]|uniref:DnaJ domain protein n=1 Tax=Dictyocaulus viviparus TaxID=29172 RepID=A0A0D8Y775_DICVI|nr:DnaJ domain protein [Dictyocaulus viviparus]
MTFNLVLLVVVRARLLIDYYKPSTGHFVKKGYYRQSLKWHPDKATYTGESSEITTVKFQIITRAYEILSDKEKRTLYDESGVIDEENLSFGEDISVWLRAFKKVASTKRKRKGMKEAKEAEETLKKIKIKEGAGSLDETIQRRQLARFSNVDSFIHSLELKYGTKNKRAK